VHVVMDRGDQENAEEIAWQRFRQAILQCQAESAIRNQRTVAGGPRQGASSQR